MNTEVWIAVISGAFTLIGVILTVGYGNSKTLYRIEQLEKKQDKHNTLIERMYKLETKVGDIEDEVKELKNSK